MSRSRRHDATLAAVVAAAALSLAACLPEPRDAATLEAGYDNPNNAACSISEQQSLLSNTPEKFSSLEDMFGTCVVDQWNDCKTLQTCVVLCASNQGVGSGCSTCFGNMGSCMDKNCITPCVFKNASAVNCSKCIRDKCAGPMQLCTNGAI